MNTLTGWQGFRVYVLETKYEFLKLVRYPIYVVTSLLFPVMFYTFFGLSMGRPGQGFPIEQYLMASYGAFGVMGATLSGTGSTLAMERGLGWLQLKRASPMPPLAYLFSKIAVAVVFSAIVILLLFVLGATAGHVRMPAAQWAQLAAGLLLGCVPFAALGVAVGYSATPNTVIAILNLLYLPMAFCSGLWIPIQFLPKLLQTIAPALPAYHLAQLAYGIIHAPATGTATSHLQALAAFALVFGGLAWYSHWRDQTQQYQ